MNIDLTTPSQVFRESPSAYHSSAPAAAAAAESSAAPSSSLGTLHEIVVHTDRLRRSHESTHSGLSVQAEQESLISSLANRCHLCLYVEAAIQAFLRNNENAQRLMALEKDPGYNVQAADLPWVQRFYGPLSGDIPVEDHANDLLKRILLDRNCLAASFVPDCIDDFFTRVFVEKALINPSFQSSLRLLQAAGIREQDRDLTPHDPSFVELSSAFYIRNAALLKKYDGALLKPYQQFCKNVFEWYFQDMVRSIPFDYHHYPISQLEGLHIDLPLFFADTHLINSKEDADSYLVRLTKVGRLFEGLIKFLRLQEDAQILPPKLIFAKVLDQIKSAIPEDITKHQLYCDFMEKVKSLPDLTDAKLEGWSRRVSHALHNHVYPAYQNLFNYVDTLQHRCSTDHGVDKLPNGREYYAWTLWHHTTSDYSPLQIHQMGIDEVSRLETLMWKALARVGRSQDKTIEEHLSELGQEHCYQPKEGWKKIALADFDSIGARSARLIDQLFDLKPKAALVTKPVPEEMGDGTALAFYMPPSFDGSIPGTTYVNLTNHEEVARYCFSTLYFHEGVPGHHFQLALQQEQPGLPLMMASSEIGYNGFCEGWALYVEELMWEHGWYHDPQYGTHPADEVGFLADALLRASRLVVDTGIHAMGWTRAMAIDYMNKHSGQAKKTVVSEVERYFVYPGQACSYKIGQFKIKELRELARQKLGGKFDIRKFHNVIIENGSLPLEVLEDLVKEYIAKESRDAALENN